MRACVAVLLLTLAACGGGSGDEGEHGAATQERTLPPAEYAARVDRLCARAAKDVAPFRQRMQAALARGGPERAQAARLADILDRQLVVVRRFQKDVEAVGLPSSHVDDAQRLVDKTDAAVRELERATDALRAGEANRAVEALQRYAGLSLQTASIARDSELPFAICGAGA